LSEVADATSLFRIGICLVPFYSAKSLLKMFNKPGMFLLAAFVTIFLSRYPALLIDRPMDPDESGMLAAVLTAHSRGFVPWKDFDVTTVGPLTTWFLAGTAAIGMPMTYQGLHILSAILWTSSGLLTLVAARLAFGIRGAGFAFLVLMIISLLAWRHGYLHFSSEAVPAALLAATAVLVVLSLTRDLKTRSAVMLAFLSSAFCALSVLAKLQALPIAAFLCAANLLPALDRSWRSGLAVGLSVVCGALLPVSFVALWLWNEDALLLGLQSYVLGGSSYGASESIGLAWILKLARDVLRGWGIFLPAFILLFTVAAALAYEGWRPWKLASKRRNLFLLCAGWFGSALVALILPSYRFEHHGVFLVAPATLLLTCLVSEWTQSKSGAIGSRGWIALILPKRPAFWFAAAGFFLLILASLRLSAELFGGDAPQSKLGDSMATRVSRLVDQLSEPGEPVAVWGWAPELNVITGRPSATRHIICHFLIDSNSARDMHRKTFMADLRESRPKVIVDAVAPGFFTWRWGQEPARFRAETFSELSTFLQQNYRVVERLSDNDAAEQVIVYARVSGH
jgi:hypothetical protein